jgi:hypothetical protein
VNASRTAVTHIVLSTLKDAGEVTGTALGESRMPSGEPSGQQEVGARRSGCPGRRIQGRGGRGPGRRDVTKVARGAAEQVLDTVVEVSPDAVGAVKRGSCRRPPSPGTSYAPSSRARRKEVVAVRPASVGEVLRPGSFRRRSSVPPNRPSSGAPCQVP